VLGVSNPLKNKGNTAETPVLRNLFGIGTMPATILV